MLQSGHRLFDLLDVLLPGNLQPGLQLNVGGFARRTAKLAIMSGRSTKTGSRFRGLLLGLFGVVHAEKVRQHAAEPQAGDNTNQHDQRGEQDELLPAPAGFSGAGSSPSAYFNLFRLFLMARRMAAERLTTS